MTEYKEIIEISKKLKEKDLAKLMGLITNGTGIELDTEKNIYQRKEGETPQIVIYSGNENSLYAAKGLVEKIVENYVKTLETQNWITGSRYPIIKIK